MEGKNPEDRPESPKKKIRPSSTTNIDFQLSDSRSATDGVGIFAHTSETNGDTTLNGVAPTRNFRRTELPTSSEQNDDCEKRDASIQEEVVSSSENTVHSRSKPAAVYGNADSLTNDLEESIHSEVDRSALSHSSEAEQKEL